MADLYRKEQYEVSRDVGDGEQGEDMVTYRTRFVPITIDYEYILDWAIDVGGLNYRPDMQEIKDVLAVALAVGKEDDDATMG